MASELNSRVTEIYQDTYDELLKFIVSKCRNPSDIPDILQNTYLRFFKRLKKQGDIREPKGYLFRIARHEIFKFYGIWHREDQNVPVFSELEDERFDRIEAELQAQAPDDNLTVSGEIWSFLRNCDVLTFKVFVLYFGYDVKLCDIAKELRVSESNVKNRLYRTIRKIRKEYLLERKAE